ncbi:helix-turn-helix transcriptional regulator [Saccharibacter floricola]|nr:AraC family transcriptional regulator [Saccharibacter floricola]
MPISFAQRHPWHYWRTEDAHIHEMSLAQGRTLALPAHCHEEDQIAFVLAGCRHFILPDHCVFVSAGQALRIPAGLVHSSRDIGVETRCVNLYLTPGYGADPADSAALLGGIVNDTPHHVLSIPTPETHLPHVPSLGRIDALAHRHHMTREAYSRRFRREYGISPQGFQLLSRLNSAKAFLRQGQSLADTAFHAGFADQSHMGRLFRRAFGTTPRSYQGKQSASEERRL